MKQKLTYGMFFLLALFFQPKVQAQTLSAGDIAFIGYETANMDGFTFIALKNLPQGETIFFTEEGWNGTGWGNQSEAHLSWVIPYGISIGTIINVTETSANSFTVIPNGAGPVNFVNGTGATAFNLGAGDQIIAYQSSSNIVRASSPTFIAAVHGDYNDTNYNFTTKWNNSMFVLGSESLIPTGLTNGLNCIALYPSPGPEQTYAKYTGALTGYAVTIRASINDTNNWTKNSTSNGGLLPSNYVSPLILCNSVSISSSVNVTCNGGSNGTASVNAVGENLTYDWTPGSPTGDGTSAITGLSAGTYRCTVSNSCGSSYVDVTITEPTALVATTAIDTQITTAGASNGAITVSVSGGTSGYTYLWNNGANTASITGLSAGTYTCTITDANTCITTASAVIAAPIPATHLSFDGVNDYIDLGSSATLKPQFGFTVEFMAYHANWSSITNLATLIGNTQSGGYAIGVSGTNLTAVVARNSNYGSVSKPLSEISSGWHHFALVYNGQYISFYMDGLFVNSNNAGAFYPITYNANNSTIIGGESSGIAGVAEASRYFNGAIDELKIWNYARSQAQLNRTKSCEIQNNVSGLLAYYNFNQGVSAESNSAITSVTNSVSGGANGTLQNFALTGATSNWASGSPIASGVLIPSIPTVVTPVNYTIDAEASALTATSAGIGLLWYSTATDGTGSATAPTPSTDAVGTTSYWVSSTNANGCEGERVAIEVVVTDTTPPTLVYCVAGNTNGSSRIDSVIFGEINNSSTSTQGYEDFTSVSTNVARGQQYAFSATTSGQSITFLDVWIDYNQNGSFTDAGEKVFHSSMDGPFTTGVTIPNTSLLGSTRMRIRLNYAEGSGNSGPCGIYSDGQVEDYTVIVTPVPPTAFAVTGGGTVCTGSSGSAIGLSDSETGVTYQVQLVSTNVGDAVAGTGEALSLGSFSAAGTYTVLATGTAGAPTTVMTGSASISRPNYIVLVDETTTACMDASVVLTATAGSLSNFTGAFAPANWTFANTNANGTVNTTSAPASIAITGGNGVNSGAGSTDYSITLPVSGTLSFNWNYTTTDGAQYDYPQMVYNNTTSILAGYDIIGSIAQFGSVTMNVAAGETLVLQMITTDNVGGAAKVFISNLSVVSSFTGTPSYSWTASNGGVITGNTDGLTATVAAAGTYTLTATVDGCTFSDDVAVTYYDAIVATAEVNTVSCNGSSDGSIDLTVSGGTAGYTYNWGDGITTEDRISLAAGDYSVMITDANGCTKTANFTITQPAAVVSGTTVVTSTSCNGGSNGIIDLTPTGGTADYTYNWGGGITTQDRTGLSAGSYSVEITDANGCTGTVNVTVTQPNALLGTVVSQTNVSCNGGNNGAATVLVSGGSGGYTYTWSNGSNASSISGVSAGVYNLYVIDSNGCGFSNSFQYGALVASVEITEPSNPVSGTAVVSTPLSASNAQDGALSVTASGGTAPYTYAWSNGAITATITGLIAGTYTCWVTDSNGCVATAEVVLAYVVPAPVAYEVTGGGTACAGGTGVSIGLSGSETGVTYQVQLASTNVGDAVAGTGEALSLGNFATAGIYTVLATNTELELTTAMTGNAVVSTLNYTVEIEAEAVTCISQTITLTGSIEGSNAPDLSWTASNGGVIDGDTDGLEIEAISSGTYTLTATVDGCMFTKEIVVDFNSFELGVTTWNGTAWSNGAPHIGVKAIIDGDLIVSANLEACELVITENGSLTVQSGAYTGVIGKVTNNAAALDFVVENNGVLVQLKNIDNEGPVTVNVNSFPLYRQDYTLWSSPVKEQNLRSFSPQTIFNRFSSYNPSLGTVGEYVQEIFTTQDVLTKEFETANGYLIRMPNNWAEYVDAATLGVSYGGVFKGVPQNGTITVPLSTANVGMNLVGNPYPSPIIIPAFFGSNPNIEQTIYYWRKRNGAVGTGYATYNNMGFVTLQEGLSAIETAIESAPAINPGQGFFVKSTGATQLNFNNEMRYFQSSGVFLRSANQEKHRFRLNLSSTSALVGQTLIGYTAAASAGVDNGYDSSYFNDSSTALTSLINGAEYIIQGLGLPFDATSSVPLGFKTDVAGTYTISLGTFDGLFAENQNIYLKDNVTGDVHNVKESAYNFTTSEGVFNSRFEVVYQNSVLGTDNPDLAINKVLVYKEGEGIQINSMQVVMQKVELYDVRGSLLQVLDDVNESKATFSNLAIANQIILVKITAVDGKVTTRKIVF